MIAYKVVTPKLKSFIMCDYNKDYTLTYNLNGTTEKIEHSLGIFCFKTKCDAYKYICKIKFQCILLKVKGISKIKIGRISSSLSWAGLKSFYRMNKNPNEYQFYNFFTDDPVEGTICFNKVIPIEIIESYK